MLMLQGSTNSGGHMVQHALCKTCYPQSDPEHLTELLSSSSRRMRVAAAGR